MNKPAPPILVYGADATFMPAVMEVMNAAFDPAYGEAWTSGQSIGMLAMPGAWLLLAEQDGKVMGFALSRVVLDEAELLLIAVKPEARGGGMGGKLLEAVAESARARGAHRLFLEVRANNPAIALYSAHGFAKVGERGKYYRGAGGDLFDAHSYSRAL